MTRTDVTTRRTIVLSRLSWVEVAVCKAADAGIGTSGRVAFSRNRKMMAGLVVRLILCVPSVRVRVCAYEAVI
jgi:cystathionine beta-lyase family protein involved in aluminum resistance